MIERKEVLDSLIEFKKPISDSIDEISQFCWDCDEELVILRRGHIINILNKYIEGNISSDIVILWANAVEGRDDIGMEAEFEEIIKEAVFRLANPDIVEDISLKLAKKIINEMASK